LNLSLAYFCLSLDKTNRWKYELYAILVEEFGTAFPISYCLLQGRGTGISADGRMEKLKEWMKGLLDEGLIPTFVFTDKDLSQIGAVSSVCIQIL
jgi:hypothetical protein